MNLFSHLFFLHDHRNLMLRQIDSSSLIKHLQLWTHYCSSSLESRLVRRFRVTRGSGHPRTGTGTGIFGPVPSRFRKRSIFDLSKNFLIFTPKKMLVQLLPFPSQMHIWWLLILTLLIKGHYFRDFSWFDKNCIHLLVMALTGECTCACKVHTK